ncbi:type VI secretion system contractile sheath large subunit [Roseospira marina]|uniref:Type VI secretion system contractile sheath large subunit n=1 Tax=Roseospira marina TaxID=140057 RepID=A0A5M6I9X9_9PROT|nr:type VI secretion system contractile sheath large subunit [Roseospira marina]KAA5604539.1 type VI secretion system contractile sheath large subunit [Roseospira marina]MBB4315283.1 type VI secretion system protein ImpD [Roseospira marina]MBB5088282.1 type VI secretion system protein ImpD [Roseospira marina]
MSARVRAGLSGVLTGPGHASGSGPKRASGGIAARPGALHPEALHPDALARFLAMDRWELALVAWIGTDRTVGRERSRLMAAIDRDIALIDRLLSAQLDAILHHPRFQKLESSWRGLRYLVGSTEGDDMVRIRVLDLRWTELCRDLERALEFDQSQLFQKIYEDEFGTPGGEPYGLLLGDYAVQHRMDKTHSTDDVAALKAMSGVCAAAFAPMVVGCTPALLGLDSFGELTAPIRLAGLFDSPDYDRWRGLRAGDDSRFLGVVLPTTLMRDAHRDDGSGTQPFRYAEDVSAPDASDWLWASPVYAFGRMAIRAFVESRWFGTIRGARRDELGGGLVEDLQAPDYGTDRPGLAQRIPVTVALPDMRESELAEVGLIPLSAHQHTPFAVFRAVGSIQAPKRYDRAEAGINARLSAMLHYMLCVSRFAHLLKVMVRDKVGSFASPEECELYLHNKLIQYVQSRATASFLEKAKRPLREASVSVRELPGRPGVFTCTCHIVPHFQVDQVHSSFRLELDTTPLRTGT